MNDRELLEMAAKAVNNGCWHPLTHGKPWNPLDNDGDALRLAVQLEMCLDLAQEGNSTFDHLGLIAKAVCHDKQDPYAATRRAIVRAAAEIGKAMQ